MQINVQFTMPNGNPATALVIVAERLGVGRIVWSLDAVLEDAPRRTRPLRHEPDHDSPRFRRQDAVGRLAYDAAFFRELLRDALYLEVLRQAWMQIMPDELKEPSTSPDSSKGG